MAARWEVILFLFAAFGVFVLCVLLLRKRRPTSTKCVCCPQIFCPDSSQGIEMDVIPPSFEKIAVISPVGRYGKDSVWHARWNYRDAAVKMLQSDAKSAYLCDNECEIYNLLGNHENILSFLGQGSFVEESVPFRCIATEYYERKSLNHVLGYCTITKKLFAKYFDGILAGLYHLHAGSEVPPRKRVAHRDIKSLNILVSVSDVCVLADFGLSLIEGAGFPPDKLRDYIHVGTDMYMAPEIISKSCGEAMPNFEAFLSADAYSFGLVIWEIANRMYAAHNVQYYLMKNKIELKVAVEKCDPPKFSADFKHDENLNTYAEVVTACCSKDVAKRLTVGDIRQRVSAVSQKISLM